MQIFCPSNHLMLDAERCPVCGWARPASGEIGKPAWESIQLKAGLGGPGRSVFATGAGLDATIAFPLRNGEVVGVDLNAGKILWRNVFEEGMSTHRLLAQGDRFLVAVSDIRSMEIAGRGGLYTIDARSGEIVQIWEADTHQLCGPVLAGDRLLVKTSKPELVALDSQDPSQVAWRRPLASWIAIEPLVVGDLVVVVDGRPMSGEGKLVGFSLESGDMRWELPAHKTVTSTPISASGKLIFCDGSYELAAFDLLNEREAWRKPFSKIYSPPQGNEELVFIVARGDKDLASSEHYQLQALNTADGEVQWSMALPDRVRIRPVLLENQLFLAGDKGSIFCVDIPAGKLVWELAVGAEEDPIRTNPLACGGKLVVGTYFGALAAVQVQQAVEKLEAPEALRKQGNLELAAAAYALQGDTLNAAQIYAEELDDYPKAIALFEHGQLFQQAGDLARRKKQFNQAKAYFEKAGDLDAQIEMMLAMGDELGAASKLEALNRLDEAVRMYEQAGEYRKAVELYFRLGKLKEVARLRMTQKVPWGISDGEEFEKAGKLSEAGEAYLEAGEINRAVQMFQQSGEDQRELDALEMLVKSNPEIWALERLAGLARASGNFIQEAKARVGLQQPYLAADAFERAAKQSEIIRPEKSAEIAFLYEQAFNYYKEAGLAQNAQPCWDKVLEHRKLPRVLVEGHADKEFREGEFNTIRLVVRNIGFGRAVGVEIRVDQDRFEVQWSSDLDDILAAGVEDQTTCFIRPKDDLVGDAVPLKLEWAWQDCSGKSYKDWSSTPVRVRRKTDSQTGGSPVVINAETYIQGGVVGDVMQSGAQKDSFSASFHRGSSRGDSRHEITDDSGEEPQKKQKEYSCPICHMPIEKDALFCDQCGNRLNRPEGSEG